MRVKIDAKMKRAACDGGSAGHTVLPKPARTGYPALHRVSRPHRVSRLHRVAGGAHGTAGGYFAVMRVPSSAPSQMDRMTPTAATSKTCMVRLCSLASTNAFVSMIRTPAEMASS